MPIQYQGNTLTRDEFAALFPNVLFPAEPCNDDLQAFGAHVVPEVRDLSALRVTYLSQLADWEVVERGKGLSFNGHQWATTPKALQDIRDVLLVDLIPGDSWTDVDRNVVPMTLADLKALWRAMVARGLEIYQRRIELEAVIANATAEQLDSLVFTMS